MTNDEYVNGPHNFWMYFVCGLVFGTVISGLLNRQIFERPEFLVVGTLVGAFVIAYCCARWGDSAWHWLLRRVAMMNW